MDLPKIMISWLLAALGRKLLSASVLIHVLAVKKDIFPQEVGLFFEGHVPARIYGGSNGASLCLSSGEVVGCDLGEYGKKVVFCASDEPCFSNVVGQRLVSVSTVKSSVENEMIGLVFSFDNETSLAILNLGDELFVYTKIPEEIIASEGLIFILLS